MSKDNVYEEITKAKKARETMIKDLRNKLAESDADHTKANARAGKALETGNADAYANAKSAGRDAEDRSEFYKLQIRAADKMPLISDPGERKRMTEQIRSSVIADKETKLREAAKYIKMASELVEGARADIIQGNNAISDLRMNTDDCIAAVDIYSLNGLSQRINTVMEHTDIKSNL